MTIETYLATVAQGKKGEQGINDAIEALGSSKEPNQKLFGIYASYRSLLLLDDIDTDRQLQVLAVMKESVTHHVKEVVRETFTQASLHVQNLGAIYGENFELTYNLADVFSSAEAVVDSQFDNIMRLTILGLATDEFLFGDADRVGLLSPGYVSRNSAHLLGSMFNRYVPAKPDVYFKQAIATIDSRTTQCCHAVNNQVQPIDKDFELTRTPHYAGKMPWSPFHDWCRTAIVLIHQDDVEHTQ